MDRTSVLLVPVTVGYPLATAVAMYMVMGEPPVLAGAAYVSVVEVLPGTAKIKVGAPGVVAGVTCCEGAELGPVPMLLVADTVMV
jgi:hypothetical protein